MSGPCNAHLDRSGQMVCTPCGLQWDADDPDPPECGTDRTVTLLDVPLIKAKPETGKREYKKIREILNK